MENNTLINGFEIFGDFSAPSRGYEKPEPDKTEKNNGFEDLASDSLTDEELKNLRNNKKEDIEDTDTDDVEEQDEEELVEEDKTKKSKKDTKPANTKVDIKEDEVDEDDNDSDKDTKFDTELISTFADVINEKLGLTFGEEDKAPQTPEELIDYVSEIIEENSKPTYYSEEVEALDNFVKNGGKLKDYFQIDSDLNLEDLDITDEVNQKAVLKQFLKEKGFSAASIEKKLTKYEDAGLLEDESEDALEALKEMRADQKQELLKNQEKAAQKAEKDQREFLNTVVNEIKGLNNIRGVNIPEKDKKKLFDYIFVRDSEGKSEYQKDWSKNVKNLIESAYFTMKGDTLLKAAKTVGKNDAINRFKQSLNKTGISKQTNKQNDGNDGMSVLDSFARRLRAE